MQRKVVWKPGAPTFPALVRHVKAHEKEYGFIFQISKTGDTFSFL